MPAGLGAPKARNPRWAPAARSQRARFAPPHAADPHGRDRAPSVTPPRALSVPPARRWPTPTRRSILRDRDWNSCSATRGPQDDEWVGGRSRRRTGGRSAVGSVNKIDAAPGIPESSQRTPRRRRLRRFSCLPGEPLFEHDADRSAGADTFLASPFSATVAGAPAAGVMRRASELLQSWWSLHALGEVSPATLDRLRLAALCSVRTLRRVREGHQGGRRGVVARER